MLLPTGDPSHPRLGRPFRVLHEPHAGAPCGPLDVLGEERIADLPPVTSPVKVTVTHVELGTTPAHRPPLSLQSA